MPLRGVVVAATSAAAFVDLADGSLAAIHAPAVPAFPFSWVAGAWRDLGLTHGVIVELGEDSLATGRASVRARRVPPRRIEPIAGAIGHAADAVLAWPASAEAAEACATLARARGVVASGALADLVGRGRGLTPSADDVIVGLLAGLHMAGDVAAWGEVAAALVALDPVLESRTTRVSAALLRAASGGVFAPVLAAIGDAATRGPDALRVSVERCAAVGATSGSDLLAGIALALRGGGRFTQ